MNPQRIERPDTLAAALALLMNKNSRPLAGGTDLLIERRRAPFAADETWIALSDLDELKKIELKDDVWHIGPLVTHAELAKHEELRRVASFLPEAASLVGSPQIREQGTVGGNIANAASCADTVPPLIALNAELTYQSVKRKRRVALSDFFLAPYKTILQRDELITDIYFPAPPKTARTSFLKLGRRQALAISRVSVAVLVNGDDVLDDVRVSVGSALPRYGRLSEAEDIVRNSPPSPERFKEAGRAGSAEVVRTAGRRWSTDYKEPVLAALISRALCMAYDIPWK
ncbi:xanthine dehydrogenase family protein subunit M [bacterium]|nr:xanthine dehydrogenase family protein subunit M [bacterium]